MSLLFLTYALSFFMIVRGNKKRALLFFTLAAIGTLAMFFYHADSALDLNF